MFLIILFFDLQLPMQSVPITTDVVSSNLNQGEVYNIMWWSLSVTCDRLVVFYGSSGFLHHYDITEILLKVALNTIKQTNKTY